ncbi:MAG: cysteine desulfurase [Blautia sp.]|nr:cysteine desulfurase [Blautia sp.]
MEIYLDHSATTRCCEEAAECVRRALTDDYGNPSSLHRKGIEAERIVRDAMAVLTGTLKVSEKEIIFTSGGTESDNLAIFGTAKACARQGKHIITSAVEHPAVSEPMQYLQKNGYELTVLGVDSSGCIRPEELEKALRPDTILVSVMHVNNEIGSVMPIQEIADLVHTKSQALLHVDAVQSFGKYVIHPKRMGIDLMSVSGHKLNGPKGVGFCFVREGVRLIPQILGGGQQDGLRSGTDNVPGIAGLAAAVRYSYTGLGEKREHLYALKEHFCRGLSELPDVTVNGPSVSDGAPHIVNASFKDVRSEVLLHALEDKGIYASAGSACSSHKRKGSQTLKAIGLEPDLAQSALRFSFGPENTFEEADITLRALAELLPALRKFVRR